MIEPGGVHAGRFDGDDIVAAADVLMEAAAAVEPSVTALVVSVATVMGGEAERLRSRLKSRDSLVGKLARFRAAESPHYRLAPFNDALRYTIVLPDLIYWRAAGSASDALGQVGLRGVVLPVRWRRKGYKGLNLTVAASSGFEFEVQLHTSASLGAAELTHAIYERERSLAPGDPRVRELRAEAEQAWSLVPVPPGQPKVGW